MYKAIRYIGSKQKILNFLEENVFSLLRENNSFFEGFSGTGIVSQYLAEKRGDIKITGADLSLYSKILFTILNAGYYKIKTEDTERFISEFMAMPLVEDGVFFNEFSQNGQPETWEESRLFFHEMAGKNIDTYRFKLKSEINSGKISAEQADFYLFYLMAYACKVANTTSVFGAYLKSDPKYRPLDLDFIKEINKETEVFFNSEKENKFINKDIISSLQEIDKVNVIYLDPPYSTRRYESNYHILNYLADLDFSAKQIKKTKTGLPLNISENPFGRKKETEIVFSEMILKGVSKSDVLAISYNTDGLIKQEWIENFCLQNNLMLETKKMNYKRFKSNNINNTDGLEEILWLIRK